jgi:regulator of nucleoside diphosphate kinase
MAKAPETFICADDAAAIARLLHDDAAAQAAEARDDLAEKLREANIVPRRALPRGIVRLDSQVLYEELPSGARRQVAIVNPRHANATLGRVSVLSPIGRALLGNAVGAVVEVPLPAARSLLVRIVDIGAREQTPDERMAHV